MKSPWLIPEIEAEVAEDRQAAARESAQRVRHERRLAVDHLRGRDMTWLIDLLTDRGPITDHEIALAATHETGANAFRIGFCDTWSLWRLGKFWRQDCGVHFGSGCPIFRYGIRKVHPDPNKPTTTTP